MEKENEWIEKKVDCGNCEMERSEPMLNGSLVKDVGYLLFVRSVMVRVNIEFGYQNSVKCRTV